MNNIVITGRLTADPKIMDTKNGIVGKYFLACDRPGTDAADFIPCTAFGKTAEFVERYLKKGMKMMVSGSLHTGSYEKNGETRYTAEVIVDRHEFMESRKEEERNRYKRGK